MADVTTGPQLDGVGRHADEQGPKGSKRLLQTLVYVAPLVVLTIGAWQFRTIVDDGWIYLRIVQNTVAGNGPVFNAGERVETYTGPLWVALLSLLGWLRPTALPWISVVTGIASTVLGLALATAGSVRLCRRIADQAFLLPFGSLVFVSVAAVWTFASTGLETGITFLWLGTSMLIVASWARDGHLAAWAAIVLGLGPLVRPDLAVVTGVLLITVVAGSWSVQGLRGAVRIVMWAAALPLAYQLFRMVYFGQVIATTAIAKEGTLLRPGWGWLYLRNFVDSYWLVIPAIVVVTMIAVLAARLRGSRWKLAALALPIGGILHGLFVVLVGGDYMHARLLLPGFFAVLAPVTVLPVVRSFAVGLLVVPWALVSAATLRITPGLTLPVVGIVGDQKVTVQDAGARDGLPEWWQGDGLYARFGIIGVPVKIDAPLSSAYPPTTVVSIAMGLQSYAQPLDFYTYDPFGLANPLAAHQELTRRALPGHEKLLGNPWMAAQLTPPGTSLAPFDAPPFLREPSLFPELTPPTTGRELAAQTEFARLALTCGALSDLVNGPREPLTISRMAKNLLGAPARTRLRVPPDPEQAYQTFCLNEAGARR